MTDNNQGVNEQELPPLPEPWKKFIERPGFNFMLDYYTADQMRAYAVQAIEQRASSVPAVDCHPSCGYIGGECDYPECKRQAAPEAPAAASDLPRWIDNQKGSDPMIDDLIAYIEELRAALALAQQSTKEKS